MTFTTTITQKGQLTIPKEIRDFLGISLKDKVEIKLDRKKRVLKLEKVPNFFELGGYLHDKIDHAKRTIDPVAARDYMQKHYERV